MKKTYINPDTKVLLIQTQQIMANSGSLNLESSNSVVLDFSEIGETLDDGNNLSRRGGSIFWDDED